MKDKKQGMVYDVFFGARKKLLLTFYIISAIAVGFSILLLMDLLLMELLPHNPKIAHVFPLVTAIPITILCVIIWGRIVILLDLPNIARYYDEIKDDIASRNISRPEDFGARLVELICNYFQFTFFTIQYACIKIVDTDFIYSDDSFKMFKNESGPIGEKLEILIKKSRKIKDITYEDMYTFDKTTLHLYMIPIWFAKEWLGFIGILSTKKLPKTFRAFLADFENYYVDDQLVHVLDIKKQILQKQFYRDIDKLSDKITKRQYSSIQEYQEDLLLFLVDKIDCIGGLFATVYSQDCVTYFKDPTFNPDAIVEYYRRYTPPRTSRVVPKDPDIREFNFVLEIPILIEELQGVIYLFDNDDQRFNFFLNTFIEIENIKLDNDLENLANLLNLFPLENGFIPTKGF